MRLLQSVSTEMMIAGNRLKISASAGVSFFPKDGAEMAVLVRKADEAMYLAKRSGKNCVKIYC